VSQTWPCKCLTSSESRSESRETSLADPEDEAADRLSLGSGITEGNSPVFRRIKHVQDESIRAVLKELDTAGEQTQEKDAWFLGQMLPATMLFSLANISSTTLYSLLIDILKDKGHEFSHIQAEYVREGIARALYHIQDGSTSRDAQISSMAIRGFAQKRDAEYQIVIAEMTSSLDPKVEKIQIRGSVELNRFYVFQPRYRPLKMEQMSLLLS
jgi:hypothetical protein